MLYNGLAWRAWQSLFTPTAEVGLRSSQKQEACLLALQQPDFQQVLIVAVGHAAQAEGVSGVCRRREPVEPNGQERLQTSTVVTLQATRVLSSAVCRLEAMSALHGKSVALTSNPYRSCGRPMSLSVRDTLRALRCTYQQTPALREAMRCMIEEDSL